MRIVFLGTNGWYSTETGNTPCVLIDSDEYYVVLDAGDGIYKLGDFITTGKPVYLFLSHFHLEHIFGFHIFARFKFEQGIHIYGQEGTRKILSRFVRHPFTVPFDDLPIRIKVNELSAGTHRVPFPVTCKFLLHSDPCLGYRINLDGKIIAYCTDTGICDNSMELARNADVLIHECAAKPGYYSAKWPHTNAQEAAELAARANVKQLVLFHFDPSVYKTIDDRKQAEREAKTIFENTLAACDGTSLTV